MARKELSVEPREVTGKKVAQLRRAGILPGNIFGKGIDSESIQLKTELLEHTLKSAVANEVIDLKIKGERAVRPVVLHKLQRNPLNGSPLHADFYQVQLREKMRADVPLVFTGSTEAIDTYNGVLITALEFVHVEALPLDIPANFEIDISVMKNLEDSIHISSIQVPDNVVILNDPELMIAKIASPRLEEEEEPTAAAEAAEAAEETAEGEAAESTEEEAASEEK